jgi:hypothetical protein
MSQLGVCMKYSFLVNLFVATLFLSGCTIIDNIEASNKAKLMNNAKESCIEYGFKEDSDSFATCIQKEINEYKNRRALELSSQNSMRFHSKFARKPLQ